MEPICVLGASIVGAELRMKGASSLRGCWEKSENGCLHTFLTLFEQLEDSLDQLLIKAITKLCEK